MWEPSQHFFDVWNKIEQSANGSRELCLKIAREIEQVSPDTWKTMCDESQLARRDSYLIRHCLPLAELSALAECEIIHALAQNFLWQVAWRQIDDAIDAPRATPEMISRAIVSVADAAMAHGARYGKGDHANMRELLSRSIDVSVAEKSQGISIEDTWARAAPFLIVPNSCLELSRESISTYKAFIAADGLAHDIHDLASDLELHIRSLPVRWLEEIDSNRTFLPATIDKWHARCAAELRNAISKVREFDADRKYIVMAILLDDLEALADDLAPGTWC